jgi:hypothetical protein
VGQYEIMVLYLRYIQLIFVEIQGHLLMRSYDVYIEFVWHMVQYKDLHHILV